MEPVPRGRVRDQRVDRLALVGRKRRDVHERRDVFMRARFGDDGAAVGVADEHDRPVLGVDDPPGGRGIVLQ